MALSVDIRKRFGRFQLETQFEAGDEVLALLGASGCGKSVTLRCIAGVLTPDEGRIVLDGNVLFDSAAKINLPPQTRRAGYLFQQYALFPNMTVQQNIAAAVRDRRQRQTVAAAFLRRFQLENVAGKRPWQISGGQQQRTALARILASEPRILLLDEPFSALDSYLKYQVELELLETLEQFHGTVLWVSHDRGEVFRNCRRVCVLEGGRSQPACTVAELFRTPATEAAAQLSGCKNYADAVPSDTGVFLPEWKITLSCGRPVPPLVRRIGIRAHHVAPARAETKNVFICQVVRVIQDMFSAIVLLRPENAVPGAPLLRMEVDPAVWQAEAREWLPVTVRPQDVILLQA